MKEIIVNLKRFDIPKSYFGVSDCEDPALYMQTVLEPLANVLGNYQDIRFTFYPPEAHLIMAYRLVGHLPNVIIGCQSNHEQDVAEHGNFGAFTSFRTASAMRSIGCMSSLIGHYEERKYLCELYESAGIQDQVLINEGFHRKIKMALNQGMEVCYCIGEKECQRKEWRTVLKEQLEIGLKDVDRTKIIIGYEPIWSIGPGKTSASQAEITEVVDFVKTFDPALRIIYGGGVKKENAAMLAEIQKMDGGLIGLTNFTDHLGFHPEEFIEIVEAYHSHGKEKSI